MTVWEHYPVLCGAWSFFIAQLMFVIGYLIGHWQAKKMCLDTISRFRELIKP